MLYVIQIIQTDDLWELFKAWRDCNENQFIDSDRARESNQSSQVMKIPCLFLQSQIRRHVSLV